jgi:vacuolar-type H+-ATPase catalytic subunit A/Vma1
MMSHDEYGEWIQEMVDYAKSQEKQIRFEFDNEVLNKKLKMLQQLAEDLGYEILPKQDKAIPLSINHNGQLALL